MAKTEYRLYGIGISHEHDDFYRSKREQSVAQVRLQVGKRDKLEFIDLSAVELVELVVQATNVLRLLVKQSADQQAKAEVSS